MVGPRLRAVLQAGVGAGDLTGPGVVTGCAEHPVCGDRLELSLRCDDGILLDVRWRAAGCPATTAVAALAAVALPGTPAAAAVATLRRALADHGGLAPAERHAEAMAVRALVAAGCG
ncbi:MAG: iron-sulfur cluster assembly scaffold protein [Planctomycetota bacterium]